MNKLYTENKRPFFRNGRLYAENRPVPFGLIDDFMASEEGLAATKWIRHNVTLYVPIVRAIRADMDIEHNNIIIPLYLNNSQHPRAFGGV